MIIKKDGLNIELNENDFVAKVVYSPAARGCVFIPRMILYNSNEYTITSISEGSFQKNKQIQSIEFDKDSQILSIGKNAFFDSSLERLSIPSSLEELEEGWCSKTRYLVSISLSENNKNFAYLDDERKIIIGKSAKEKEEFDVLHFACRDIDTVNIPSAIKYINSYAFEICYRLKKVEISESSELISIGENSFSKTQIKSFSIPKNVIIIGIGAFYKCKSLVTIDFDKKSELKTICKDAFYETLIKKITITSKLEELKEGWCNQTQSLVSISLSEENKCFSYLDNDQKMIVGKSEKNKDEFDVLCFASRDIKIAKISSSIKQISSHAFNKCEKLKTIEFSSDSQLLSIGDYCFFESSLNHIIIPPKVKRIGDCAFSCCYHLESLKIPKNSELISIGVKAFDKCAVQSLFIPANVEEMKEGWCGKTWNLHQIELSESNKNFAYMDDQHEIIIGKSQKEDFDVIHFASRDIMSVDIPPTIKYINSFAFESCEKLKEVKISTESELISIGENSFSNTTIGSIFIPKHVSTIGNNAFHRCSSLAKIEFDDESELKIIGQRAFAETNITSFSIPSKVEEIREGWCEDLGGLNDILISPLNKNFSYLDQDHKIIVGKSDKNENKFDVIFFACRNIKNIETIPAAITRINSFAFEDCSLIENVEFAEDSQLISLGQYSFGYSSIKSIVIPAHLNIIEEGSFSECKQLQKVEIPENSNLFQINKYAFSSTKIKTIFIPSQTKKIGRSSFFQCKNLASIKIPENSKLLQIKDFAISYSSLEEITIPSNFDYFKSSLFSSVNELKNIIISPSNKNLAFLDPEHKIVAGKSNKKEKDFDIIYVASRDIESAIIPSTIKYIYSYAFDGCMKLHHIIFSDDSQLEYIGNSAFSRSMIQNLLIPKHVKEITNQCFSTCINLSSIEFPNDSELKTIKLCAFTLSSIERLVFPPSLENLEESWCYETEQLNRIEISPKSTYFKYLDEEKKVIVGKTDKNSDDFNIIYFACRDIKHLKVPSNIKYINSFAFFQCNLLSEIKFADDSELISIGKSAFSSSSLNRISFPKSVEVIEEGAFLDIDELKSIEFSKKSEVITLGSNSFAETSIENIVIPSNAATLNYHAFNYCSNLKTVEFLGIDLGLVNEVFNECESLIIVSFPNAKKVSISNESVFITGSSQSQVSIFLPKL